MALIPGYEYDIFISYVHADNEPETGVGDGWIDQFYKYLDTKLNKHNKKIKIWWDSKQLDGSQVFDKTIEEAIDKSAIILCLNSRLYAQSEYCQKELQHFYKKALQEKTGLLVGDRSRIINVLLSNIHYNDWLPELSGTSGFVFHDEGDYGDPLPVLAKEPFSEQMKLLRNALVKMVDGFLAEENEPVKPKAGFTIYFGEINDSLVDRRDGIISELEDKGYTILKGDAASLPADVHSERTREAMDKAQLAVHLMAKFPGRKVIDEPESRYIQKQVEIGMESPTPQLIWLATDLNVAKIENEEHRSFLTSLEDGSLSVKDQEIIRSNEAELAQLIMDHAERLKKEEIVRDTNTDTLKVLLDTHTDDFQYAFDLKKNLTNNDVRLIFNPEDGDPQENIEILYENINEAQKYIFLYGKEENNDWVDVRVKNTMKKLVEFDRYDQSIFVYLTPPHKETKDIRVAQSPMVKIVDNSNTPSIDPVLFDQFLNDLKAVGK